MPTRRDLANAIRALSMNAVQKANSGHPGAPMGTADIAQVSWRDVLKFNPENPIWLDRDRPVALARSGRDSVLPRRVAVEAAAREPWWRYVGLEGRIVGIDHFGASAPAKELFRQYGFTVEHVLQAIDGLFI